MGLLEAITGTLTGLRELTKEVRLLREATERLVQLKELEVMTTLQQRGRAGSLLSGYTDTSADPGGLVATGNTDYTRFDEIRHRCQREGLPPPELDADLDAFALAHGWPI